MLNEKEFLRLISDSIRKRRLYYNDTPQDPAVLENILFSNDPNDEINKRINEIVEEIKINLEPIYKDKQFKWKKQR